MDAPLRWNEQQLGLASLVSGIWLVFWQLVVWRRALAWSAWGSARIALVLLPLIYLVCPAVHDPWLYGLWRVAQTSLAMGLFGSIFVMITEATPPARLATVNGYSQTAASAVRIFGPSLAGYLFAYSVTLDTPRPVVAFALAAAAEFLGLGLSATQRRPIVVSNKA